MPASFPAGRPRCRSGRHVWSDPLDAERCCSPRWRWVVRYRHSAADIDPRGRRDDGTCLVYGWMAIDDAS